MKPAISIKARIGLALALLATLVAVGGVLALPGLVRISEDWRDTCANEMFSQRAINVAELYAARERLVLDRAGFEIGTPDAGPTLRRARMMRGISDEWWKKYIDLPRDAEEDRFAQAVAARRDALHEAADAFTAIVLDGERAKLVAGAKAMQVAYDGLSRANEALDQYQAMRAQHGYEAAARAFGRLRNVSIVALLTGMGGAVFSFLALQRAVALKRSQALVHVDAVASDNPARDAARKPVPVSTTADAAVPAAEVQDSDARQTC